MRHSALRVATLEECMHFGRTLPRGLLPPIAGAAGPALDHALGAAITATSPTAVTVSNSVSTGELVVAYGGEYNVSTGGIPTLSDSASNSYTSAASLLNGGISVALSASVIGTVLTGSSSTVSATEASSFDQGLAVGAASFTGCTATAAANKYASNTGSANTQTPSISTSASVNAGDLVVAVQFWSANTITVTQPGTWAALSTATGVSTTIAAAYFVTASAGTVTYAPTNNTSGTIRLAIAAFPAALVSGKPIVISQAVQRSVSR